MADNITRSALVRFKNQRAGRLIEQIGGAWSFAYDPDWTETIGCALPRERGVISGRGTELPAYFQHLTSEGWLRGQQALGAGVDDQDDFGLLLAYGADCIGAVSVHQAGPEAAINSEGITNPAADPVAAEARTAKRTISGVQRKLLVTRDGSGFRPAHDTDPAYYIAKLHEDRLPNVVQNEDRTLALVRELLGHPEVVEAERAFLVDHVDRNAALVVKRFDRTSLGDKLRLEDFCQILDRPRGRDHHGKYRGSIEEVGRAIEEHSGRPRLDLVKLFERTVVNVLVGNTDAHLKNFSLLETSTGLRLSPIYDVVNTAIYAADGYSTNFALAIAGEDHRWSAIGRPLLEELGRTLTLEKRTVAASLRRLKTPAGKALARLRVEAEGEIEPGFRARYTDIVQAAYLRIFEND
jgi:serine/threonine-protein kinase HipA